MSVTYWCCCCCRCCCPWSAVAPMLANAHATTERAGAINELTVERWQWESCVCFRKDLNISYLLVSNERGW
jgi:hypothetical protein